MTSARAAPARRPARARRPPQQAWTPATHRQTQTGTARGRRHACVRPPWLAGSPCTAPASGGSQKTTAGLHRARDRWPKMWPRPPAADFAAQPPGGPAGLRRYLAPPPTGKSQLRTARGYTQYCCIPPPISSVMPAREIDSESHDERKLDVLASDRVWICGRSVRATSRLPPGPSNRFPEINRCIERHASVPSAKKGRPDSSCNCGNRKRHDARVLSDNGGGGGRVKSLSAASTNPSGASGASCSRMPGKTCPPAGMRANVDAPASRSLSHSCRSTATPCKICFCHPKTKTPTQPSGGRRGPW